MKLEIRRDKLVITVETDSDLAFVEDTLKLKAGETVELKRSDTGSLTKIVTLEARTRKQ